mmetsp:Transcript_2333/g.7209  ORF Transcript_2333/g.7209 Transcript_2333/m.7209 type:complete len:150 (+) Transcript_2333:36-485(+)
MSKRKTPTSSSEPTLTLISEQRPLAEQRRLDGTIGRVRVTIELLDDTLLTGWLEEADGQMNVLLSAVDAWPAAGDSGQHKALRVRGQDIRCLRLPPHIDAEQAMRARLRAIDQAARTFSQRKPKAASARPTNLPPLVGSIVTEADADLG